MQALRCMTIVYENNLSNKTEQLELEDFSDLKNSFHLVKLSNCIM